MKVLSVALSLLFAAGFIQMAEGIVCHPSFCAACWKIGSPGVDIKMSCGAFGNCPWECPNGYNNIHCAAGDRCWWVDLSYFLRFLFSVRVLDYVITNIISRIGAGNLIVKTLARVIVESRQKMVIKLARYLIQARSVQVDSFFKILLFARRVW